METQTQELTIIERSLDTFKSAPAILMGNKTRAEKAVAIGQKILADLQAADGKMTPELDQRMNNYLVNCSNARKEMNDNRKIITQTMTMIASEFTSDENMLDVTKDKTVAAEIQRIRNDYARQLHEAEQERQRQIRAAQERDTEKITLRAECEKRLIKYVGEYTTAEKQRVNAKFNAITLDTFEAASIALARMEPVYPYTHLQSFAHSLTPLRNTRDEMNAILKVDIESKFAELATEYKRQITELRDYLIDRLPSKRAELESIREMEEERARELKEQERIRMEQLQAKSEQDRQRLEQERIQAEERQRVAEERRKTEEQERQKREHDEQERQKREHDEQEQRRLQTIEANKQADHTMNLFAAEATTAEVEQPLPQARQGYEIAVLNPAGWMLIFQMWFNEEGKGLPNDKIEGTKMESMKTFCEKLAHKKNTKIESPLLRYDETFKAVNKKTK